MQSIWWEYAYGSKFTCYGLCCSPFSSVPFFIQSCPDFSLSLPCPSISVFVITSLRKQQINEWFSISVVWFKEISDASYFTFCTLYAQCTYTHTKTHTKTISMCPDQIKVFINVPSTQANQQIKTESNQPTNGTALREMREN